MFSSRCLSNAEHLNMVTPNKSIGNSTVMLRCEKNICWARNPKKCGSVAARFQALNSPGARTKRASHRETRLLLRMRAKQFYMHARVALGAFLAATRSRNGSWWTNSVKLGGLTRDPTGRGLKGDVVDGRS